MNQHTDKRKRILVAEIKVEKLHQELDRVKHELKLAEKELAEARK